MVRTRSTPLMIVVGLAMVVAALGLSSTEAEAAPPQQEPVYPEVCPCAVEVSVGGGTVLTEECVSVVCRATDTAGAPVVNLECRMSVIAQPGTDATVTPASVMTDENGEAEALLCAGSTAGSIVVEAETDCCGSKGQLEVATGSAIQTPLPTPTVLPPTGVGTGGGNSSSMPLIAIWSAIALGALAAGSVLAWQIGGWRRRSS